MKKMTPEQKEEKIKELNGKVREINKKSKEYNEKYNRAFRKYKEAEEIKNRKKKSLIAGFGAALPLMAGGVAMLAFSNVIGLAITMIAVGSAVSAVSREVNKSAAVDDVLLQQEIQKENQEVIDEYENFDDALDMAETAMNRYSKTRSNLIKEKYGYQRQRDDLKEELKEVKAPVKNTTQDVDQGK